ncbi:ethanolamine permease, partial [Klebsiella pneumoniae]|nr:ethanolamine permease [Klebsiella pneumoniae]
YRAFGPTGGVIAGFAPLMEVGFAPPAIALAIGAYLTVQCPALDPKWVACVAFVFFMTLNILGVGIAANFELIVTLLAI